MCLFGMMVRQIIHPQPESDDHYDGAADLRESVLEAFRLVRERVARGGPGWVPAVPGSRLQRTPMLARQEPATKHRSER